MIYHVATKEGEMFKIRWKTMGQRMIPESQARIWLAMH